MIMKKISLLFVLLLTLLTACKKEKEDNTHALQKKWSLVNTSFKEYNNGTMVYEDNYTGLPGDYLDFRTDNKLYTFITGANDVMDYKILDGNKVTIDGDTFDILTLNSSAATLYLKEGSAANYSEVRLNLKR